MLFLILHQRKRQLIGAARAVSALYALEQLYNAIYRLPGHQMANPLEISGAAALKLTGSDYAVLYIQVKFF